MNITRILVPLDFSPSSMAALQTACDLAHRFQAPIDLLTVVEPLPPSADLLLASSFEQVGEQARAELANLAVPDPLLTVRKITRIGYPAQVITDYAEQAGIDLIVIGTHGRTGLSHLLMGSVAERVVRTAPCPVFVARVPPKAAAA